MMRTTTPSGLTFTSEPPTKQLPLMAAWEGADRSRQHRSILLLGGSGSLRRLVMEQHIARGFSTASLDGPAAKVEADYDALRLDALCAGQSSKAASTYPGKASLLSKHALEFQAASLGDDVVRRPRRLEDLTHARAATKARSGVGWIASGPRTASVLLQYGALEDQIGSYHEEGSTPTGRLSKWLRAAHAAGAQANVVPSLIEIDTQPQSRLGNIWFEAHDLLSLEGRDIRDRPWAERHALLGQLLAEVEIPQLRRIHSIGFVPSGSGECELIDTGSPYGAGVYLVEASRG